MDDETLRQYHLSRQNMLKVLSLRGYYVPESHNTTFDEFRDKYGRFLLDDLKLAISGYVYETSVDKSNGCILLSWHMENKLGVSIRDIVNEMENENIKRAIVVSEGGVTSSCNEIIKNLKITKNIIIDTWSLKESMVYVPDHVLVPHHRICSVQEKKALFKAHGLTNEMLPRIKHDDIMVKYLGASKGQLIEITKKSETNPDVQMLKYRIVV
jgi:DNA-directed RNA polymerases I, II, and III subunit RPABC1